MASGIHQYSGTKHTTSPIRSHGPQKRRRTDAQVHNETKTPEKKNFSTSLGLTAQCTTHQSFQHSLSDSFTLHTRSKPVPPQPPESKATQNAVIRFKGFFKEGGINDARIQIRIPSCPDGKAINLRVPFPETEYLSTMSDTAAVSLQQTMTQENTNVAQWALDQGLYSGLKVKYSQDASKVLQGINVSGLVRLSYPIALKKATIDALNKYMITLFAVDDDADEGDGGLDTLNEIIDWVASVVESQDETKSSEIPDEPPNAITKAFSQLLSDHPFLNKPFLNIALLKYLKEARKEHTIDKPTIQTAREVRPYASGAVLALKMGLAACNFDYERLSKAFPEIDDIMLQTGINIGLVNDMFSTREFAKYSHKTETGTSLNSVIILLKEGCSFEKAANRVSDLITATINKVDELFGQLEQKPLKMNHKDYSNFKQVIYGWLSQPLWATNTPRYMRKAAIQLPALIGSLQTYGGRRSR